MPSEHRFLIHKIKKPGHDALLEKLANDFLVRLDANYPKGVKGWCNEYSPGLRFTSIGVQSSHEGFHATSKYFSRIVDGAEEIIDRFDDPVIPSHMENTRPWERVLEAYDTPADFFNLPLAFLRSHGSYHGQMKRIVLVDKQKLDDLGKEIQLPPANPGVSFPEERVILDKGTTPTDLRGDKPQIPEEACHIFDVDESGLQGEITSDEYDEAKEHLIRRAQDLRLFQKVDLLEADDPSLKQEVEQMVRGQRAYKQIYNKLIEFAQERYGE